MKPTNPGLHGETVEHVAGAKSISLPGSGKATPTAANSTAPKMIGNTTSNHISAEVTGGPSAIKPAPNGSAIPTGPKGLVPTGKRNAAAAKVAEPKGTVSVRVHPAGEKSTLVAINNQKPKLPWNAITGAESTSRMVSITKGQRVPNVGAFAVYLNSQYVKFDVLPRVDDGVPMTPFRYLLEKDGGKVDWANVTKTVTASADGKHIVIQIGDKNAKVNEMTVTMEVTPYIDHGRTIVPLSFIHDALNLNVEYDKETGHVLITSLKK